MKRLTRMTWSFFIFFFLCLIGLATSAQSVQAAQIYKVYSGMKVRCVGNLNLPDGTSAMPRGKILGLAIISIDYENYDPIGKGYRDRGSMIIYSDGSGGFESLSVELSVPYLEAGVKTFLPFKDEVELTCKVNVIYVDYNGNELRGSAIQVYGDTIEDQDKFAISHSLDIEPRVLQDLELGYGFRFDDVVFSEDVDVYFSEEGNSSSEEEKSFSSDDSWDESSSSEEEKSFSSDDSWDDNSSSDEEKSFSSEDYKDEHSSSSDGVDQYYNGY